MSFLKSTIGSAFKLLIASAIIVVLCFIGARLALSYMIHETKQRWNDAAAFTHLYGKKAGDPALDALVSRHMAGDTGATHTLMNKALVEGKPSQQINLLWEAVERASDPQLYDLLAKHQQMLNQTDATSLMSNKAKKMLMASVESARLKLYPTLTPALRESLAKCYERLGDRYEGITGNALRVYDDYRAKRTCDITLPMVAHQNVKDGERP